MKQKLVFSLTSNDLPTKGENCPISDNIWQIYIIIKMLKSAKKDNNILAKLLAVSQVVDKLFKVYR